MKTTRQIFILILAPLCATGCKPNTHVAPPPPIVEVANVTQADVPIYHEWIGTLDGLVNAQIRAQVTGYLLTQNYREGDPIKKGDLLFEIDSRPFRAALDQAKVLEAQQQLFPAQLNLARTQHDQLLAVVALYKALGGGWEPETDTISSLGGNR